MGEGAKQASRSLEGQLASGREAATGPVQQAVEHPMEAPAGGPAAPDSEDGAGRSTSGAGAGGARCPGAASRGATRYVIGSGAHRSDDGEERCQQGTTRGGQRSRLRSDDISAEQSGCDRPPQILRYWCAEEVARRGQQSPLKVSDREAVEQLHQLLLRAVRRSHDFRRSPRCIPFWRR